MQNICINLCINLNEDLYISIKNISIIKGISIENVIEKSIYSYYRETKDYIDKIEIDISEEIWKDIPGYEDYYQVSNFGRIKSFHGGVSKIKKLCYSPGGYVQVGLTKNKKLSCFRIHRLVAISFLTRIEGKNEVDHINGIKIDNRVTNLRWVNKSENIKFLFERSLNILEKQKSKGKKVEIFDKNGNTLGIFENAKRGAEFLNMTYNGFRTYLSRKNRETVSKMKCTAKYV